MPGIRINLLERSGRVGGRIATERVDGYLIESGPDGFVTHKPAALDLAKALGLSSQVIHSAEHLGPAYVRRGSTLHRLPDGLSGLVPARLGPLLRSRVLSVPGRIRMAFEPWIPAQPSEDESLDQFFGRRFGREAARRLFEPLFGGIYGRTEALSAQTTVPQLLALEREHGSVIRGLRVRSRGTASPQKLASFADGMSVLPERAKAVLESAGVCVDLEAGIRGLLVRDQKLWFVRDDGGNAAPADAMVVAVPVQAAGDLLARVAPAASGMLSTIQTGSSAVVVLGFPTRSVKRTLDASGYVVAGDHGRPVTACTWSSVKFAGRAPAGSSLFRVFFGADVYSAELPTDDGLVEMAMEELRETVGARGSPDLIRVHRHHSATPRLVVGHADRVAALETALYSISPPIEVAGNYLSGVGIADAVAAGRNAAQRIADRLRRRG
jgi:oxygen-dependent protoporphyrinogen oxidase